jgi:peptide/nickel transport system ATP-binding protein
MSDTRSGRAPILSVRGLKVHYHTSKGVVRAVDGIDFDLERGQTLGLVGESGCGKTTTGAALLGMSSPPGRIAGGSIVLDGKELVGMPDRELRREVRWARISMVFQGAMNCLTPVYTIRALMAETWREHSPFASAKGAPFANAKVAPSGEPLGPASGNPDAHIGSTRAARGRDGGELETLMRKYVRLVGMPESVLDRYPHELSGGMKQRVVIAMALFLEPKVVVMDEPTTALDVIVQAQILNLIKSLKSELGLSYIFITHDLATEAEIADRIMVMYAGKLAELGSSEEIFGHAGSGGGPAHPYTRKLLASTPRLRARVSELAFIPGSPPDLISPPTGCRFAPRCAFAKGKCERSEPPVADLGGGHLAACWKAVEDPEYERS